MEKTDSILKLQEEVTGLKRDIHSLQDIILKQSKQISDIHKALFNNPNKTKAELYDERRERITAEILMKSIKKRNHGK